MVQIGLLVMAAAFFWEGAKGFRSSGIKVGLFKADSEPLTGTKAKIIGSCVIAIGLICLFFALVYIPFMMGRSL